MRITLRMPYSLFADIRKSLSDDGLLGTDQIGEIHLVGDWNNWGDSPQLAGCVRPRLTTIVGVDDQLCHITVNLPVGIHQCKPVVITSVPDADGFCTAAWLPCPYDSGEPFRKAKRSGNWEFVVKGV